LKIYTKTGDKGETSLFGGRRVPKDTLRIETYGTLDELNCIIGVCRSLNTAQEVDRVLTEIQNDLFVLGAELAAPADSSRQSIQRIQEPDVSRLERHIDTIEPGLAPLDAFILPGGSRTASMIHLARAVCRRAERLAVHLSREEAIGPAILTYVNRLSDLLFILARWVNALSSTAETKWNPR
jgi:cob(I)alamin adenosyltransferase